MATLDRRIGGLLVIGLSWLGVACGDPTPTHVGGDERSRREATTESTPSDAGWLARAEGYIAAREYHASGQGQDLQAPNRAHGLRTFFGPDGIRVHDRTAVGGPELVRLSLTGLGRGEAVQPVAPGEAITTDAGRVEIRRPELVEWYENSEAGLEQGFTLGARPTGDGPLALELAVTGARADLRGDSIVLATNVGRNLS